ncbi:MAG: hypothetical protein Q4E24_07505 [bacterium]|nr:hypothetical protein [bacterium]
MRKRKYRYKRVTYDTSRNIWIVGGVVLICILLAAAGICVKKERKVRVLQQEVEQLEQTIAELSEENRQLQEALGLVAE